MSSQLLLELALIGSTIVIAAIILLRSSQAATTGNKLALFLTFLLGAFLTMAGTVKFFDPFTSMFSQQIAYAELPLPTLSRWAGQLGEIGAGLGFLAVLIFGRKLSASQKKQLLWLASGLTLVIMTVALYVHLLPQVPAEVLPMQSKPPVLTLIVMALVAINYKLSAPVSNSES